MDRQWEMQRVSAEEKQIGIGETSVERTEKDTQGSSFRNFFQSILSAALLLLFVLHEYLGSMGIRWIGLLQRMIAFAALPLGMIMLVWIVGGRKWKGILIPVIGAGLYILCGFAGWGRFHYQSLELTVQSMLDGMYFWLELVTFYFLFRKWNPAAHAVYLFVPAAVLSLGLTGLTCADLALRIWPNQAVRFGIPSIQLFYGHPTIFGVRTAFLLGYLCLLMAYLKKGFRRACGVCIAALQFPLFMTLRTRILGFMVLFALVWLWCVHNRRSVNWKHGAAGIGAALAVGSRRLYRIFFSAEAADTARNVFMRVSLQISAARFPFGTGFGTFGSRIAQYYYSPVYYWYDMIYLNGMDPTWPAYACDTFWPMILGESGFLGLAGYLMLLLWLSVRVHRVKKLDLWLWFAACSVLLFELFETTATIAFAEAMSVGIAAVLGMVFGITADAPRKPSKEEQDGA